MSYTHGPAEAVGIDGNDGNDGKNPIILPISKTGVLSSSFRAQGSIVSYTRLGMPLH